MNATTPIRNIMATPGTPMRKAMTTPRRGRPRTPSLMETPSKSIKRKNDGSTTIDRFIPNRSRTKLDVCSACIRSSKRCRSNDLANANEREACELQTEYERQMKAAVLDIPLDTLSEDNVETQLLFFGDKQPPISRPVSNPYSQDNLRVLQRVVDDQGSHVSNRWPLKTRHTRNISNIPLRVLDAPEMGNDFYSNTLSWNNSGVLAVALGNAVYLWNAETQENQLLMAMPHPDEVVTSVSWAKDYVGCNILAIATLSGPIQLWDTDTGRKVRTMKGHYGRVGSLAWSNGYLSSGGKDSKIMQHDVRKKNHIVSWYVRHEQEVCGLKWDSEGNSLASGGNDNLLCIWDAKMSRAKRGKKVPETAPRFEFTQHTSAVKALAWSPFRSNLLASGGGYDDKSIKLWNTQTGKMLESIDTGSQVSGLLWSKHKRELLSSHGYGENQLILWSFPRMIRIKEMKSDGSRLLQLEQNADGSEVVASDADERILFWDMFGAPPPRPTAPNGLGVASNAFGHTIR